jgi:hypothetical protein
MKSSLGRLLTPSLNPTGLMAAAGLVYAAVAMLLNAHYHHGVIDPAVIVAAVGAVAALLTRQIVTPVKNPRDGNGVPLAPHAPDLEQRIVSLEQATANLITGIAIPPPPVPSPAGTVGAATPPSGSGKT